MRARTARQASAARQAAILDAALRCFSETGYAAATVEEIRERSGASVGSIYHHFGSKERIAAALYLEGLRDYHAGLLARLRRAGDAEDGVKAIVVFHLRWVERHPEWARFLLTMRHAEFMAEAEEELGARNRAFFAEVRGWFERHAGAGALVRIPLDVCAALLIGPAQEFSRHWLAGRTRTPLREAERLLSGAVWRMAKGARA